MRSIFVSGGIDLGLFLATFAIRMASAWMALRLYRRSREQRFAFVTFALAVEGHSIKEIGAILNVSPKTVEFHKYRLMEQLDLRTTAELTQYAGQARHRVAELSKGDKASPAPRPAVFRQGRAPRRLLRTKADARASQPKLLQDGAESG